MRSRTPRLLLAIGVLCLTGGASLAAEPDDETISEAPLISQPPVESVEGDQRSTFGVLRRQQTADDAMPPEIADYVGRSVTPDNGAAPRLARRAVVRADGSSTYVIPARGSVCRFTTTADGRASGGCNRTGDAMRGRVVSMENPAPGITRITGLVPDGVAEVVLRAKDGGIERTEPQSNVYVFETALSPKQIEWGSHVIPVLSPRTDLG